MTAGRVITQIPPAMQWPVAGFYKASKVFRGPFLCMLASAPDRFRGGMSYCYTILFFLLLMKTIAIPAVSKAKITVPHSERVGMAFLFIWIV